jgi:hypothetical protein
VHGADVTPPSKHGKRLLRLCITFLRHPALALGPSRFDDLESKENKPCREHPGPALLARDWKPVRETVNGAAGLRGRETVSLGPRITA